MFVHISPEVDAVGETISTLKFAERVATVELGAARLNKESGDVKELKEQVSNSSCILFVDSFDNAHYLFSFYFLMVPCILFFFHCAFQ